MSTTNSATTNPTGAPGDPSAPVYRRLMRALADLGISPQPNGDAPQRWATLDEVDGTPVVAFGSLSIATAARLANLLEDIAAGTAGGSGATTTNVDDESEHDPDGAAEYALAPFEPVASPLEPYQTTSRHHPRTAW